MERDFFIISYNAFKSASMRQIIVVHTHTHMHDCHSDFVHQLVQSTDPKFKSSQQINIFPRTSGCISYFPAHMSTYRSYMFHTNTVGCTERMPVCLVHDCMERRLAVSKVRMGAVDNFIFLSCSSIQGQNDFRERLTSREGE